MNATGFFDKGDEFLEKGGQVGADALGEVPGVGEVVEALQAEYHGQHAWNDVRNGDWNGAAKEGFESVMHGLSAVPVLHEVMEIPNYVSSAMDVMNLVGGGDVPLVGAGRMAMDKRMGIERDLFTGERTNAPLVSPQVLAAVHGHYAD